MRRRTRQVIVEVSPTRFELAVYERGTLIGHRSARPAEGPEAQDWPVLLQVLEKSLTAWVAELGVEGQPAVVLYTGADTAASIFDAPASAGERRAREAAQLAMADTISYPLDQNAFSVTSLGRDGSSEPGVEAKLRTLAIADTEATLALLSMTLQRCGLKPEQFIPAPGASLAAAVSELRRHLTPGQPRVLLWLGEHSGVLAGGDGGGLRFARLIPVGLETLIDAITGLRRTGALEMDAASARELLLTAGIPSADGWTGADPGIDPHALLPAIQPVLQRLVVEIKQSIRFGFAQEDRGRVTLCVAGTGSAIDGLGEAAARVVGVGFAPAESTTTTPTNPRHGDLAALLALDWDAPSLYTREAAENARLSTVRRAIAVGAMLGLVVVGTHAMESWQRLGQARDTLAVLSGRAETSGGAMQAAHSAMASAQGLAHAEALRRQRFEAEPLYPDLLRELAARTPQGVELTEIVLSELDQAARATLRGVAFADDQLADADRFSAYTASLADCPLVLDVALGETRRSIDSDRRSLHFHLTLELVELPTGARTASAQHAEDPNP